MSRPEKGVETRCSRSVAVRASTTAGSNWWPAPCRSLRSAFHGSNAERHGRSRDHRVVRVAGEHDAARERDLLALEPLGVSSAVPVLVQAAHDRRDVLESRKALDHLRSPARAASDDLPLVLVERAFLQEDRVGNADLAGVVQARGERDLGERSLVEAQLLRDPRGEPHDALRVLPRVAVVKVDRGREGLDARGVRDLEALVHVALLERDRAEVGEPRQKLDVGVVEGRRIRLRARPRARRAPAVPADRRGGARSSGAPVVVHAELPAVVEVAGSPEMKTSRIMPSSIAKCLPISSSVRCPATIVAVRGSRRSSAQTSRGRRP